MSNAARSRHASAPGTFESTSRRKTAVVPRLAPWLVLPLRAVLFPLLQAALAIVFLASGIENAWEATIPWWPVYLILANLITFMILRALFRREGLGYSHIFKAAGARLGSGRRVALIWAGIFIAATVAGGIGFVGAAALFYSGQMPEFVAPLPMWAAWLALLVMPISIALVELPLYFGYAMPRLEALTRRSWLPLLLAAFWLAIQHSTLPLIFDLRFAAFRFVQMILLALVIGIAYQRTRRLAPLMLLHFLADLQLGITVFLLSRG